MHQLHGKFKLSILPSATASCHEQYDLGIILIQKFAGSSSSSTTSCASLNAVYHLHTGREAMHMAQFETLKKNPAIL